MALFQQLRKRERERLSALNGAWHFEKHTFSPWQQQGSSVVPVPTMDMDLFGDYLILVKEKKEFHVLRTVPPFHDRSTALPVVHKIFNPVHVAVTTVRWHSQDAGMFFASGPDGILSVWDTSAGAHVCSFGNLHGRVAPIRMHAPSRTCDAHALVAVASDHPDVVLCDVRTGSSLMRLTGHATAVHCVEWSPSSEHFFYSAADDGAVLMWDTRRCTRPLWTVRSSPPRRTAAGAWLLAGPSNDLFVMGGDGNLGVWNVKTQAQARVHFPRRPRDAGPPNRMSLAGGALLVPWGATIAALDCSSGLLRCKLRAHYQEVRGVLGHPSRPECYSHGPDGLVVWTPPPRDCPSPPHSDHDQWSDEHD